VLSDARSGNGFAPHVPHDPDQLTALRERRDRALAAELRAEREEPRDAKHTRSEETA